MQKIERLDPADLTRETSLFEIYGALRRELPEQPFNKGVLIGWMALTSLNIIFSTSKAMDLASSVRTLAELGLSFAASILGFLLAGFTIFATMSKPGLLVALASFSEKQNGPSELRLGYFALIEVFIDYLGFAVGCLAVRILCLPGSGLASAVDAFDHVGGAKAVLCKVTLWAICSAFMWIVLKLKSFIYNVYHLVMTGVYWEVQAEVDREAAEYAKDVASRALMKDFELQGIVINLDAVIAALLTHGYVATRTDYPDRLKVHRDDDLLASLPPIVD